MKRSEILDGIKAESSLGRVKVFTDKDFHLWKFQFLTFVEVREVEGYFDWSIITKLGEDVNEEEKKKWKKGDFVSRNILLTTLNYNQMQQ